MKEQKHVEHGGLACDGSIGSLFFLALCDHDGVCGPLKQKLESKTKIMKMVLGRNTVGTVWIFILS